ncbi:MAG: aldehyde dehydrogenase, partial [Myxococcota bacterium]|nr:aldehyde dehydrogenase [Myxococcota bacterium]
MDKEALDKKIARLREHATEWARMPIEEKIAMGRRLMDGNYKVADRQVKRAIEAKKIPASSPLVGEEWLGGPLITLRTLRFTLDSLEEIARGNAPKLKPGSVRERANGQVAVKVFPHEKWDPLLFKDFEAEIWMDPELSRSELEDSMGVFYKEKDPEGIVSLVLGAGNVASIGSLDVVYKLYAEGQVCLLKMNPVNEYLGEFIEEAFSEFIERGFLELAYGGADVGAYLFQHEDIDEIHITGSDKTHDAIVYG